MTTRLLFALVAVGLLTMSSQAHTRPTQSQTTPAQATQPQTTPSQTTPANAQKPPASPPKQEANPFPDDTTKVPVMPSTGTPALPPGTDSGEGNSLDNTGDTHLPLPSDTADPMRSPDDPAPDTAAKRDEPSTSSSSSSGDMDRILGDVDKDDQTQGRHRKMSVKEPEHQETSAEDIEVGKYEMDRKNWKAALSRFQSAMVLAPDEPDVYWGLAESERHLGNLAAARGYYQKLAEYDPDSRHGKEAVKALKEPEIANAKAAPPATPSK